MQEFIVKGTFKLGNGWQKFNKEVTSQNEKNASDKVYSIFGSKHNIKRMYIKIEDISVKEE
ncbi:MAG: 50S ribosomal protein L18a [Methanosarcinaceae archaeon]|nr:50S ribosomal protein L18a [Methanosarcinaceae archaeon]NKQ38130.1 50S ribosomal protein L18a [Methanosarcinales archaeon]